MMAGAAPPADGVHMSDNTSLEYVVKTISPRLHESGGIIFATRQEAENYLAALRANGTRGYHFIVEREEEVPPAQPRDLFALTRSMRRGYPVIVMCPANPLSRK